MEKIEFIAIEAIDKQKESAHRREVIVDVSSILTQHAFETVSRNLQAICELNCAKEESMTS
jgi:hypothetical protein